MHINAYIINALDSATVDDVDKYSFLHDMPKQTSSVSKSRDLPALATSTF